MPTRTGESQSKRRSARATAATSASLPASGASASTRALVALAAPIATAMGGETLMGLVDTKLVGGLGPAALGGVGVAMTIVFFGYLTIFGLMRGVKVCVAHAAGQGLEHRSVRYAQAGMALGLVAGAAVWAATRDVTPLLRAIRIDPALVPYAQSFIGAFTFGAPASAVVSALTHHRQAIGDARTPMVVGLTGNVFNALLGWSLIYGHAGLPALGVRGGALATAAAEILEAIVLVALLVRRTRRSGTYRRARAEVPLGRAVREVAHLGVPTGLQFGSEMLAFATFTALLGTLGAEQIAAHQIALATIRTSFLPGTAISEAASVLVGQALGRRSLADADGITRAALRLAVTFMATCGLVFAVCGGPLVRAFTSDPAVVAVARRLLLIAAGFQVLDAVSIVLRGALRGARDVRIPAIIGVAVVWTCVPTAALLLGRMAAWGAAGGWCGFIAETTLSAILFNARWRRGSWRRAYAAPASPPFSFEVGSGLALRG
ncbi:MAG TPA: MATE family efflux transporter, partial [Polyangiaceae bacterium]|nr:MATE family efflux transporter [Polyangiaceae bacterium]